MTNRRIAALISTAMSIFAVLGVLAASWAADHAQGLPHADAALGALCTFTVVALCAGALALLIGSAD